MAIKWSALKVSEAMDMVEELADQIEEPLRKAKRIVAQAKELDRLPLYTESRLQSLEAVIGNVAGGAWYKGCIHREIESVRGDIPDGALEAEKAKLAMGEQQTLIH